MHLAVTATAVATEVDSSLQTINEFGRLPYAAPEDNTGSKAASEGASKGEQLASHSEAERTDVQAELEQETARRESLQEAYHNLEGRLHQAVRARDYAREQAEHAEQQVLTLKHQVNELLQDRIRLETQLLSRGADAGSGTASQTRLLEELERWQLKAHKAEKALEHERAASCALRRHLEAQRAAAELGSRAAEVTAALQHQVAEAKAAAEERRREVEQVRRALAISDETVARLKHQLQSLLHVVHQGHGAFMSPRVSMTAGASLCTSPSEQQAQQFNQHQQLEAAHLPQQHSTACSGSMLQTPEQCSQGASQGKPMTSEHNHDHHKNATAEKASSTEQKGAATPTAEQEQLVTDLRHQCAAATRAAEQLMTENAFLAKRINEQANIIRHLQEGNRRGQVFMQSGNSIANGRSPLRTNGSLSSQGSIYSTGSAPSIQQPFQREHLPGGLNELQWKLVMVTEEVQRLESEVRAVRAGRQEAGQADTAACGEPAPMASAVGVDIALEAPAPEGTSSSAAAATQSTHAGSSLQHLYASVEGLDLPPAQLQARVLTMAARMAALAEELEGLQVGKAGPSQQPVQAPCVATLHEQQQQQQQPSLPSVDDSLQEVVVEQQQVLSGPAALQPALVSAAPGGSQPPLPPPSYATSDPQTHSASSESAQLAVPGSAGPSVQQPGLQSGPQLVQAAMTVQLPLHTTPLNSSEGGALDASQGLAVRTQLSAPLVVKRETLDLQPGLATASKAGRSGLWGWLAGEDRGIDI